MSIYNIIIFHYPCQDGLTSAWIADNYHKLNYKPLELYPISHSDKIDLNRLKNKKVLFCDFCPSLDILNEIEKIATEIKILDHHKSSMENLKNKVEVVFLIVANIDLPNYKNQAIKKDLRDLEFYIEKGEILAYLGEYNFELGLNGTSLDSIIKIRPKG